jgi:hypothetical protein
MSTNPLALQRDAFGRLVLTDAEGHPHVGVVAVRAFPIAAPAEASACWMPTATSWPGSSVWTTVRRRNAS